MSERSHEGKEGRGGEGTHVAPTAVVASPAAGPSAKNKPSVRSLPADATTATPWLARYSAMIWVGELLVQLTTLPSETLMTSTPSCTARIMAATICEGWEASGAVEVEGEAVRGGERGACTHDVVARDLVAARDLCAFEASSALEQGDPMPRRR